MRALIRLTPSGAGHAAIRPRHQPGQAPSPPTTTTSPQNSRKSPYIRPVRACRPAAAARYRINQRGLSRGGRDLAVFEDEDRVGDLDQVRVVGGDQRGHAL